MNGSSARILGISVIPVVRLPARSITFATMVAVPILRSRALVRFMSPDQAPCRCSKEAMMSDDVARNAADHGPLHTAARICRAGRKADDSQHCGCRYDNRFLHQILPCASARLARRGFATADQKTSTLWVARYVISLNAARLPNGPLSASLLALPTSAVPSLPQTAGIGAEPSA